MDKAVYYAGRMCSREKEGMKAMENICVKEYDVIIVGAGAAGLFAAACFSAPVRGLILNGAARPGIKLLMAGNGQCNITHGGSIKDFIGHYGENGKAVRSILYKFNNEAVVNFFEGHGVPVLERPDGKVFPKSMKASDVCDLLLQLAQKNGFEMMNSSAATGIWPVGDDTLYPDMNCYGRCESEEESSRNSEAYSSRDSETHKLRDGSKDICGMYRSSFNLCGTDGFVVRCRCGEKKIDYYCKNLIVAAGGKSYPTTGSDGSMVPVLERLGIAMTQQRPALVPVFVQQYPYSELSGISFKKAEMTIEGQGRFMGDILFTHENFSGPLILDNSRYIKTGSNISICYLPGRNAGEVSKALKKSTDGGNRKAVTLLLEYCNSIGIPMPKRFLEVLLRRLGIEPDYKAKLLTGAQIDQIAGLLMADRFSVSGLGSYNCAMSTAGGIRLEELQSGTLELKKYPHLYAIGEILDVDGDTGGYNLQFAFSSAHAAVKAIETDLAGR